MILRRVFFGMVLLGLALMAGCAKGGNGDGNGINIVISDGGINPVYITSSVTFTATVTGTSNTAVAWSLSGSGCSGNPNPCGSIDANSGVYTAPATVPSSNSIDIMAVSEADSTARQTYPISIVYVSVIVAPTPVNVGHGLVQQFVATAAPDNAPQTFTWTCTQGGTPCANFVSNSSGLAVYTAQEAPCGSGCITVSATANVDPTGCTAAPKYCVDAKVSVLASRLVTGTYALRFSGYDGSNNAVAAAGSITVASNGAISGIEDEITSSGPVQHTITGGSYTPSTANDNNTNNAGILTLTGASPGRFQVVLDAIGDFQLLQSGGSGTGSGFMQKSATSQFNTAAQTYAFGLTGVDSNGNRVGFVGVLPMSPSNATSGSISGGQLDSNDNGSTNNVCGAPPCAVTGSYQADGSIAGLWHMTLTTALTQHFDFFISSGQTKNVPAPLTLYAISTDTIDSTHPALLGPMVYQDPGTTYDKTALNSEAVSDVSGVDSSGSNTQVALVVATGNSNGGFAGSYDANNAGTIVAAQAFSACTYTTGTGGRYVINLTGSGTSCGSPMPFVFYASGANRGFLLDQSSKAVMTGAMDPQNLLNVTETELASVYEAITASSASPNVTPIAANLVLTSSGNSTFGVAGTQYPGAQAIAGAYTLTIPVAGTGTGTGTFALTAPASNYVFYTVDSTHFKMIDVDKTVKSPAVILFQQ